MEHAEQHHTKTPYKPGTTFYEMTGMILARQHRSYHVEGAPDYVWSAFRQIQTHNLIFGWWSVYAIFINPLLLIANTIAWFIYKRDYNDFLYNPAVFQERQKRKAARRYKSEHRSPWTVIKWTFIVIFGFFGLMLAIIFITAATQQ